MAKYIITGRSEEKLKKPYYDSKRKEVVTHRSITHLQLAPTKPSKKVQERELAKMAALAESNPE